MDEVRGNMDEKARGSIPPAAPGAASLDAIQPKMQSTYFPPEVPVSSSLSTPAIPGKSDARANLPPGTSLSTIFRYHMGIESDGSLVPPYLAAKRAIDPIATGQHEGRRAVNLGIYNRAIREEKDTDFRYKLWSLVINAALGLQIVFAAILTALGAGSGPPDAVAAFGTLNTIIAGFLTYLKGTGLPMRMKYFHNQWLKLRAYIEQRERDFASDDIAQTHQIGYAELMEEIQVIEQMYQNIRKDIERHTPDSYSGNKAEGESTGAPGEGATQASLAQRGLNAFRARLGGVGTAVGNAHHDVEGRFKGAIEDVEKRISGHLNNHLAKLEEQAQEKSRAATSSVQQQKQTMFEGAVNAADAHLDAAEESLHDVSDLAAARMHERESRALELQRQAEARVKDLERRLAAVSAGAATAATTVAPAPSSAPAAEKEHES